ncbi:MAG TPA: PrsW family glutamic-type intramembrane protease [Bryobacteraceae bacterium]|nr:PrsW family glutamic-type intramembrane protease [Bryobacteraceae bacterium]
MTPADQWYYLEGSETRGPVTSAEIARMIKAGSLSTATQVAQAGWPQWTVASIALAHLLSAPGPSATPSEQPIYAIKIHCVSGPDAGKAYMIGVSEVALGRVSGIGQSDPQVTENHVALSRQNNVLQFRTIGGAKLRVGGAEVTQGTLSNGQQFQLGASTWQVGSAPVELSNLLGSLGARLNKLTSTEKLEGFSLTTMFSEVFKGRKRGEIEDYFVVGTSKTTPPLDEVETGWPRPWFFMRVLGFMLAVYFLFSKSLEYFSNPCDLPGLMMIGALAVPLATVVLFWELNTPRNVAFMQILMMIAFGGVTSFLFMEVVSRLSNLGWLGTPSAGIVEETAKLLTVIVVVRSVKYKYILNGMVFGAAVGAGFAAFETAGYSFFDGYLTKLMLNVFTQIVHPTEGFKNAVDHFAKNPSDIQMLKGVAYQLSKSAYAWAFSQLDLRSYFAPFGHIAWTAIAAGAFWRVKGADPFRFKMLVDPIFVRTFLVPVILHMTWDTDFVQNQDWLLRDLMLVGLGVIAWYVAFLLVQQGLKQIKQAQVTQTQSEYTHTREILTTTGRFRAQQGTVR